MATMKMNYIGESGGSGSWGQAGLYKALKYIVNPMKTENGKYVSAVNCLASSDGALKEMMNTKKEFGKEDKRQGYHFIVSFKASETDKESAWKIIQELAESYFGKKYECLYSMHTNTKLLHGHFVFNSVSFMDGIKYRYENDDWRKYIQPVVDAVCCKYGFGALEYVEDFTKENIKQYTDTYSKTFNWTKINKQDIDEAIEKSESYDQFIDLMKKNGYQVKYGANGLAIKKEGMLKYRRCTAKTLGYEYTDEAIKERISIKNRRLPIIEMKNVPFVIKIKYKKKAYFKRRRWNNLFPFEKNLIRSLYKMGLMKKSYSKKNTSWKKQLELKKKLVYAEDKFKFVNTYGIHNYGDFKKVDIYLNSKLEILLKKKDDMYKRKSVYKKMMDLHAQMKEIENEYLLYEKYKDHDYKNQYEKFTKLNQDMKNKFGHSYEEVSKLIASFDNEYQILRNEIKVARKNIFLCHKIQMEQADKLNIKYEELDYKDIRNNFKRTTKDTSHNKENEMDSIFNSQRINSFQEYAESKRDKVKTFNECMNHNTDHDYSKKEPYFCCMRTNPDRYIEMISERKLDYKRNEYTRTSYTLYKDGEKITPVPYSDERVKGWDVSKWFELRDNMKTSLEMNDDLIMFYNEKDFYDYQKIYLRENNLDLNKLI